MQTVLWMTGLARLLEAKVISTDVPEVRLKLLAI